VIIFSDPQDVAPEGTEEEDVYEYSLYLPGDGMQVLHHLLTLFLYNIIITYL